MLRFSANISTMFTEYPLLDRFAATRRAGFDAVELQFPYDHAPEDLAAAQQAAGVVVDLVNVPAGDFATGVRGIAGVPGHEAEFRAAVIRGLRYAQALGAAKVNVLAGLQPAAIDRETCLATLAANLAHAADAFAPAGIRVLAEAVNRIDMPGFLLGTTAEAAAAVRRAGHANLGVQADLYHMAQMGEDPAAALAALGPLLGHIQFSDRPGRGEPGSGTLDHAALFRIVAASGYRGYVAAEYKPTRRTEDTLGWREAG